MYVKVFSTLIFLICPSVEEVLIAAACLTCSLTSYLKGGMVALDMFINIPQDYHLPFELDVIVVRKYSVNQHFTKPTDWKCYYTG